MEVLMQQRRDPRCRGFRHRIFGLANDDGRNPSDRRKGGQQVSLENPLTIINIAFQQLVVTHQSEII